MAFFHLHVIKSPHTQQWVCGTLGKNTSFMSNQTTTHPPTPPRAEIPTTFLRHDSKPGINLQTHYGPAKIRPVANGWSVYALVKGSAIGCIKPSLRQAMFAAMQIRGVTSTLLIDQIKLGVKSLPVES